MEKDAVYIPCSGIKSNETDFREIGKHQKLIKIRRKRQPKFFGMSQEDMLDGLTITGKLMGKRNRALKWPDHADKIENFSTK